MCPASSSMSSSYNSSGFWHPKMVLPFNSSASLENPLVTKQSILLRTHSQLMVNAGMDWDPQRLSPGDSVYFSPKGPGTMKQVRTGCQSSPTTAFHKDYEKVVYILKASIIK